MILDTSNYVLSSSNSLITTLNQCLGTHIQKYATHPAAKNPLFYDAVIVDEASLVDIEQMAQLVDALDSNTRLILLGDRAQLTYAPCHNILTEIYHTPTYHATTVDFPVVPLEA